MVIRVGVVGLGNMGRGMALSLQRAGLDCRSTAATDATRARAATDGVVVVRTLAEVARHAEVIVLSLPNPDAVVDVVEAGDGLLVHARAGQLVVDTTTSDVPTTRRVAAALAVRDVAFVDAPVSGAPELAREGRLTLMVGGDDASVARVSPVLEALGTTRLHVGPLGAGQTAKLANNLMAAAHFLIAGEIATLARAAGLDLDVFLQVLNASTGRSFITERVYPHWIQRGRFDLGFAVGLMRKDIRLALQQADRLGLTLPLVSAAGREWLDSAAIVRDDEDITRISDLPARRAVSSPS